MSKVKHWNPGQNVGFCVLHYELRWWERAVLPFPLAALKTPCSGCHHSEICLKGKEIRSLRKIFIQNYVQFLLSYLERTYKYIYGPLNILYINSPTENSLYPKERLILQTEKCPDPKECLLIYAKDNVIDISIKMELQLLKMHLLSASINFVVTDRQISILNNQKASNFFYNF